MELRPRGGGHRLLPAPAGRRRREQPAGDLDPLRYPPLPDSSTTSTRQRRHRPRRPPAGPHPVPLRRRLRLPGRDHGRRPGRFWLRPQPATSRRAGSPGSGQRHLGDPSRAGHPGDRRDRHRHALPDLHRRQHPGSVGRHRFPARGAGPDGWAAWQQIDDIYAAAADATVYMLDPASGLITGGSGLFGMRSRWASGPGDLPLRRRPERPGGHRRHQQEAPLPGGFSVFNPLPTWGASDAESASDGEADITRWLRHRDRLVTAQDFSDITWRTPAIDLGRVEAACRCSIPMPPIRRPPGRAWLPCS